MPRRVVGGFGEPTIEEHEQHDVSREDPLLMGRPCVEPKTGFAELSTEPDG